jgi:hypothetical protein
VEYHSTQSVVLQLASCWSALWLSQLRTGVLLVIFNAVP